VNSVWFEETLALEPEAVDDVLKSLSGTEAAEDPAEIYEAATAQIRFAKPRWTELDEKQSGLLRSGGRSRFMLVRLGYEFDLSPEQRAGGTRFVYARCSAYLWPTTDGEPKPSVYEVMPKDLYEGEPQTMQIKLSPSIGIGPVTASPGELSTSITIGHVEPAVIGWTGEEARAPYWELRPRSKTLLGTRYLWLIAELPNGCAAFDIAVSAAAEIKTPRFARLSIGPKKRAWSERRRQTIGKVSSE
jgi:hypothetical protein